MEGLGRTDKAPGGSIFFLFRTIPLMNSPLSPTRPTRHALPSPPAPRARVMQANPDPSAGRLSSPSLDLANSPIQLAYHQTHSPKPGLSQGPGFMLKVAFAWACTCHSWMVQDRPNHIRHISTNQRTITEFTPSSGGSVPFQPSTAGHVLFRAVGRIEVGESG